jgi:prepilin-type N-terminal cleavage/methylation domain-containing protein
MIKAKNHQAFSLIEISVVIVIIGILIAGISSGIDMYQDYRLASARNLTKNAPISRISDLKLWLETTSEKAFKIGATANINDYTNIAVPNDQQDIGVWQEDNATKYPQEIAYQVNNFKPSYIKNGIGGLPSLYFDGKNNVNGDFMIFDGSLLSVWEDGFTVFVVERRTSLGSPSVSPNYSTPFQYILSSSVHMMGYGTDDWVMSGWNAWGGISKKLNDDRIHCYHYNNKISLSDLSKIFLNGKAVHVNNSKVVVNLSIASTASGRIALFAPGWTKSHYTGLISEIIIYARPLANSEISKVHLYLANKYKIRLE